jgi:hypothetical protein
MRNAVLSLFSIAALCLMLVAVRAAQTSQNLTVVVTPSSGSPPAAAAAGFTTLVRNDDFSQAQPSDWITCDGSDTMSATGWFAGDTLFGRGANLGCGANVLATDPLTGQQALDQIWLETWDNSMGNCTGRPCDDNMITTRSQSGNTVTNYSHGYSEATLRIRLIPLSQVGQYVV